MIAAGADAFVPSLARARREGLRALARRWWRGGEATNLLDEDPDESRELDVLLVGERGARVACLPAITAALGPALATLLETDGDPPECLRIDRRRAPMPPYRTAARPAGHGDPALLEAWTGRGGGLPPGPGWAWPFTWLRYDGRGLGAARDVALVVRPDGRLHAIVSPPR